MKNLLSLTLFCLFTLFSIAQESSRAVKTPTVESKETKLQACQEGQFTVKLKENVRDFSEQSGMVFFDIPSLDTKVQQFAVYKVEKRFKFNPKKARAGLSDLSRIYKFYDSRGQLLSQLINENQPQGKQRVNWNAQAYSAGIYFYTVRVDNERHTGKIIRLN
jgi:hypothetical protein